MSNEACHFLARLAFKELLRISNDGHEGTYESVICLIRGVYIYLGRKVYLLFAYTGFKGL